MPSHEDWLNDLSLTPPKSLTMQPVNLGVLVVVPDDELGLAHPAASKATAASAAPAWRAFLTCYLLVPERPVIGCSAPAGSRRPARTAGPPLPPGASRARGPHTPASG